MNYCAIISEFNPFTNGHEYIIREAKRQTGLDILCLMSGNFVQRGEMAIINKYERATAAIKNGASIAIELPLVYAISSAEIFASGAIKILNGMKNVTHLAFGVETKNISLLEELANLKVTKNNEIKEIVKKETKNGLNYNKASVIALKTLLKNKDKEIDKFFTGSNNILALEYLTAIKKENSHIIPVYITRTDNGYNSKKIAKIKINGETKHFAPASYIRNLIYSNKLGKIKKLVPNETFLFLSNYNVKHHYEKELKLNTLILNELRKNNINSLSSYYDYSQSLAGLIHKTVKEQTNIHEIISIASGKSFRPARIKKLLLYPLLNITKENFNLILNNYQVVNVLAVAENKKQELSKLKNQSETNLIVSSKDYNNEQNKKSLELNELSSDIYNLVSNIPPNKDQTIFI